MARILVTGGAGYIGSHACKALAAAGHEPVTFDNFSSGWHDAVQFGPSETGDIRDPAALDAVFAKWRPEAVIHFAALIEVGVSVRDPAPFWSVNVAGTLSLLEAMRRAQVNRLIYSSTCAVHGDQDGVLLDETRPTAPLSPYAQSKLAVEQMVAGFGRAYGLQHLGFRYFNVAGGDETARIGEHHRPETHLIPLALNALTDPNADFRLFGEDYPTPDGTCIRDYVHVEDLIEAHLAGLAYLDSDRPDRAPVITLGTGHGFSVREVITATEATTGRAVPHRIAPRRAGDPASLVSGSALAREHLGWEPSRSTLPRMIADAWRWHQGAGFAR